jgi:hypothetical protein
VTGPCSNHRTGARTSLFKPEQHCAGELWPVIYKANPSLSFRLPTIHPWTPMTSLSTMQLSSTGQLIPENVLSVMQRHISPHHVASVPHKFQISPSGLRGCILPHHPQPLGCAHPAYQLTTPADRPITQQAKSSRTTTALHSAFSPDDSPVSVNADC